MIRSPIPWGVLLGIIVGYFGIPVLMPGFENRWSNYVWYQPYGFYATSILRKETGGSQSYQNKTKNFVEILSNISKIIPRDFDQGYPAN